MTILLIDPAWHEGFLQRVEKAPQLTAESIKELYSEGNDSPKYQIDLKSPNIAITKILGPLTKQKDFFFSMFSNNSTTYTGIIDSIQAAEGDDEIEEHELHINSPGGDWIGLTEAANAIAGAKKPVRAKITGMATSAAYVLASQTDEVVSTTDGNEVGGLGVVVRHTKWEGEKTVRSSNAPKKNPDAFTAQGEKDLKKELDAIETKVFKMVSEGRTAATGKNITEKVVSKDFGQGALMLADEALQKGMIDSIIPPSPRISNSERIAASGKGRKLQQETGRGSGISKLETGKKMDKTLDELRAEYPQLCAQLLKEGRDIERDQVKGHITMAKQTGAVDFALECLDAGKSLSSQEVIAGYMCAGKKLVDLKNREDDNPDGDLNAGADDGANLSEQEKEKALLSKVLERSSQPARKGV